MILAYDRAALLRLPSLVPQPWLADLLARRVAALGDELLDWTEILLVEPGDTEAEIAEALGASPLVDADGWRWGEARFAPAHDHLHAAPSYFELLYTFGSTYGRHVVVLRQQGVLPELLAMCEAYADDG